MNDLRRIKRFKELRVVTQTDKELQRRKIEIALEIFEKKAGRKKELAHPEEKQQKQGSFYKFYKYL